MTTQSLTEQAQSRVVEGGEARHLAATSQPARFAGGLAAISSGM